MTIKYITYTPTYNTENSDFDFFKNATDRESYIQQVIDRDGKKMVQNIIKKSNSKIEYRGIYIHPKMPVLLMARVPKGGTIENFKNYISILNIDTSNFALKSELSDFALKSEFDKFALKSELPKCKEYYLVKEEYKLGEIPNNYTNGLKIPPLYSQQIPSREYLTTDINELNPLVPENKKNYDFTQYAIDGKTKIGKWEFNPTPEKVIENITKNTVKIIYTYLLEFKPDPNFDFTKDSDGDGIPDYKDTTPVGIEDPEATEEIKNDKNYVKPTQPYSSETSNVMQGLDKLYESDEVWTFNNIPNYSVFLYKDNKLISSTKADRDGNLVLHDNDGFSLKNNYDLYVQEKGKLTKKVDKVSVTFSGNSHGKFIKDNQKVDYIQYKVFRNFNLSPFKDEFPIPTEIEPGYKFRKYDIDFNSEIFSNIEYDLVISAKYDYFSVLVTFTNPKNYSQVESKEVPYNGTLKLFTTNEFPTPYEKLINWKRQSDGKLFVPGDTISNIIKEETFEAVFEDRNPILILNPGSGSGEMQPLKITSSEGYVTLPESTFTPYSTDEFAYWEIEGEEYFPGDKYYLKKDTYARAFFDDKSHFYTFTFDTKGGTPIQPMRFHYRKLFKFPDENLTKLEGKKLKNWKAISNNKLFNPGESRRIDDLDIAKEETFEAIWENDKVTLTYDIGNGTGKTSPSVTVDKGTTIRFARFGANPPKGYKFKCWQIESKDYQPSDEYQVTKDVTAYAIYEKISQQMHTITFDLNNGTDPKKKYKTISIEKGNKYKLPECQIQPPKDSEFDCWEIDGKEFAPGTEIRLEKDTIIKAVWKRLPPKPEYPEPEIPGMKEKDHDTPTYPTQNP